MTSIDRRMAKKVQRAMRRRSFCTLATSAPERPPHVTGAVYALVDGVFYISTLRSGIKVRNIAEGGRVAVCIPIGRIPFVPPFCLHFQGRAEVVDPGDAVLRQLLSAGRLRRITSHGELDEPDNCFIRIRPGRRVVSYGIGVSLRELIRNPLHATRSTEVF